MKKVIAITFLAAYLFSTTHVSELLKLPKLIEHYEIERNWDPSLTVWSFLVKHYTNDVSIYADYEEDMKLPFKSLNDCNNNITSFYTATPVFKIVKRLRFLTAVKHGDTGTAFYSSSFLSNIWQPPKSC